MVTHLASSGPGPAPLVLLVEDDRDSREMYAQFLGLSGLRTAQAHDGLQALEKAKDLRPSIIITDLALPGIDGFELCRRLKESERTKEIPVIAVTGRYIGSVDRERAKRDGCEAVLIKPCSLDTLLSEIHRVLEGARLTRERSLEIRKRAQALIRKSAIVRERSSTLFGRFRAHLSSHRNAEALSLRPKMKTARLANRARNSGKQSLHALLDSIQGEYLEMPGLRLTAGQAEQLWGLDTASCLALLTALVEVNFLTELPDRTFVLHKD